LRCFRCVWYCWSKWVLVDVEFMLARPHERLQNHTFVDEGVFVKINSCGLNLRILRVATSSNKSLHPDALARARELDRYAARQERWQ